MSTKANKLYNVTEKKVRYLKGAFKNYVDRKGWVGGQSNVYESK